MRAVEDDHVDRPGVQARRRVEPTGTNRPIGLIALVIRVRETRHSCRKTSSLTAACLPNTALAVAAPCAAQCQTPCDAPVWWPERRAQNPIPSRTRPLNTPAPMVLCLKTRESRSPPDPPIASHPVQTGIPSTRHRSSYQLSLRCFRVAGLGWQGCSRPKHGDAGCTRTLPSQSA